MSGPAHRTDHLLTPGEIECLDLIIEEAAEVIKAAVKLKRFGRKAVGGDSTPYDNVRELGLELGDLTAMIEVSKRFGMIDRAEVGEGYARKINKLRTHTREIGKYV